MAMKKKEGITTTGVIPENMYINSEGNQVFSLPPVPSLPKTTVNPQPTDAPSPVEKPGDNKGFSIGHSAHSVITDTKLNRPVAILTSISIDAIHKSTLESPLLANLVIGKNEAEVLQLVERFLRAQLSLNQKVKNGEL